VQTAGYKSIQLVLSSGTLSNTAVVYFYGEVQIDSVLPSKVLLNHGLVLLSIETNKRLPASLVQNAVSVVDNRAVVQIDTETLAITF